ncbi:response regulator [Neobacillus cucumis]|uniref:response regulator n=1 Tax=Neobacillus cucumis TaxID=1740721 RepID=UPI00203D1185|nr:response regulator [Neobacillus cucumis]MCM3725535.1 response regulator [Neobacillus cucumis]
MDLNKYKYSLVQKVNSQLSMWFDTKSEISNIEVYRFLHSLYTSAGTLQLVGLYQLIGFLMGQINAEEDRLWEKEELRTFLEGLFNLTKEYEILSENEAVKDIERRHDENVPLIQIIDDDISMLILLKAALEENGWIVVSNIDPAKAISQYYDLNPDCVMIDINLPGISGLKFLEEIEHHTHQHFVSIIIMSLMNDRETRIKAFQLGADDFMEKPIDLEELTVRIARHLKRTELLNQALSAAKADSGPHEEIVNDWTDEITKRKLFVSIIDDDPIIRTMLMRILNVMDFSNFDVSLAEFGDGVQFFKSNRLEEKGDHFLIIDGVMPIMDGIEVLQKVQKIKHSHKVHVLMLTGRKSEADIEKALALGADDYVTKPFSIKELQARIQRLIKRMN